MAILNPYSKTTYVNGTAPDLNAVNLNKNEQGVYDVTEKVRELAAYETNAAASAVSAASSAVSAASSAVSAASSASAAAASVADYTGVVEDIANLKTVVANHSTYSTTEEVVIGTYDGKTLYRKAMIIPALDSVAQWTTLYEHGVANISKIMIGHNSHATNGIFHTPMPYVHYASADIIGVFATATDVGIVVGRDRSSYSATIFIEYTKTTD